MNVQYVHVIFAFFYVRKTVYERVHLYRFYVHVLHYMREKLFHFAEKITSKKIQFVTTKWVGFYIVLNNLCKCLQRKEAGMFFF